MGSATTALPTRHDPRILTQPVTTRPPHQPSPQSSPALPANNATARRAEQLTYAAVTGVGFTANGYFVQDGELPYGADYLRAVGGSGMHWMGLCLRLHPDDAAGPYPMKCE